MSRAFLAHPALLVLIGAGIGMMAGLFGVGGGFLLTPLLYAALHVPINRAVGTGLAALLLGMGAGAVSRWRAGHVAWAVAGLVAASGLLGAYGGVAALEALHRTARPGGGGLTRAEIWVPAGYVVLLVAIGVGMWWEASRALQRPPRQGLVETRLAECLGRWAVPPCIVLPNPAGRRLSVWPLLALGGINGFLSALLGIAGGPIMVPALIYVFGLPTHLATGTSLAAGVWVVLGGAVEHWRRGNVELGSAVVLGIGAAGGAVWGAWAASRLRGALLRRWFAVPLWAMAVLMGLKLAQRL
jgi:uncharacterized membrane protein YfcA